MKAKSSLSPSDHNFSTPTTTSQNIPRHPQIAAILAKLHPSIQPLQYQDHSRLIYSVAERLANTSPENPALLMSLHHLHLAQKAALEAKTPTGDTLEDWTVMLCKGGIK